MTNSPPVKKPLRVAVVDDHEPFRKALCGLLERRGYSTWSFDSVAPFVESRAMTRIDCLILDLGLPETDDLSLEECLRQTNSQFPIILCMGRDISGRLAKALGNRASVVLQKPVTSHTLMNAVDVACSGRE